MNTTPPLQSIIDPFVTQYGGEIVSTLMEKGHPKMPPQADYLFRKPQVIVELKALEEGSFSASYARKMSELTGDWKERGLLLAYGTTRLDLQRVHPVCQREWVDVIGEPMRNVISNANRQIRATAEWLRMPDAKGLLWLASDGNTDLQPSNVWFLLNRIFRKTKEDGSRQYSHIKDCQTHGGDMLLRPPG